MLFFSNVLTFPTRSDLSGKSQMDSGTITWHKPVDESSLVILFYRYMHCFILCDSVFELLGACVRRVEVFI